MAFSGAPLLVVENVRKTYTRGLLKRRQTFPLSADLVFAEPRIVGVIGPNGAGKTTLFEMITGSNTPTEGRIVVAGRDIQHLSSSESCGRKGGWCSCRFTRQRSTTSRY